MICFISITHGSNVCNVRDDIDKLLLLLVDDIILVAEIVLLCLVMCVGKVANDLVNLIVDEDTNNNRVMTIAADEIVLLLLYGILHMLNHLQT